MKYQLSFYIHFEERESVVIEENLSYTMVPIFSRIRGFLMKAIEFLLILINIITFVTFGIDKYLARKNYHRISEKTLLSLSLMGGSIGAIIAQGLFAHKTQKFKYILWLILFIQVASLWLVLWNSGQK